VYCIIILIIGSRCWLQ